MKSKTEVVPRARKRERERERETERRRKKENPFGRVAVFAIVFLHPTRWKEREEKKLRRERERERERETMSLEEPRGRALRARQPVNYSLNNMERESLGGLGSNTPTWLKSTVSTFIFISFRFVSFSSFPFSLSSSPTPSLSRSDF